MLVWKCLLLNEEANIVMDYPALNVSADYSAPIMPKLEYIYTTEICSEWRRLQYEVGARCCNAVVGLPCKFTTLQRRLDPGA